jgi:hypothetical protein
MEESPAFKDGYSAYGRLGATNPYPPDTPAFLDWEKGNAAAWVDNFI